MIVALASPNDTLDGAETLAQAAGENIPRYDICNAGLIALIYLVAAARELHPNPECWFTTGSMSTMTATASESKMWAPYRALCATYLLENDTDRDQQHKKRDLTAKRRSAAVPRPNGFRPDRHASMFNDVFLHLSGALRPSLEPGPAWPRQQQKQLGSSETRRSSRGPKVCIVGGGITGLYSAMILEDLGLEYDLFESSERLGGRIRTHHFSEKSHDYYEVGAMRFPNAPMMSRLFDLIDRLGLRNKLIPAYMSGPNEPKRFNDRTVISNPTGVTGRQSRSTTEDLDPFRISEVNGGPIATEELQDPDEVLQDAWGRFRDKIKQATKLGKTQTDGCRKAWQYLMKYDKYSVRQYLEDVEGLNSDVVRWLETATAGTGWYETALTENVLESLAFEWHNGFDVALSKGEDKQVDWFMVDGGAEQIIQSMRKRLNRARIHTSRPVKKLSLNQNHMDDRKVEVHLADENSPRHYSAVLNSTTLPALQKIDTLGLSLPYDMKTAIRSLRYESSTKVGMKFSRPWWRTECGITQAGMGKTDLPMRLCVYPSYSVDDPEDEPAVLLCSYTWGQDSNRIANYTSTQSPQNEECLRDLLIDNLARLHAPTDENPAVTEVNYQRMLAVIKDTYVTHHAFDWNAAEETAGGTFAFFAPGQFSKSYPALIKPAADGRFHIVGEAASAHHAWVVGGLDSAVRGLYSLLDRFHMHHEQRRMLDRWGGIDEFDIAAAGSPVGLLVDTGGLANRK